MHTTQRNYIKAKALWDAVREEVNTEHAIYVSENKLDIMSDADIDRIVDHSIELQEKYGYTPALDALLEAEKALLAWGHEQVKVNLPRYPQFLPYRKDFDTMFTQRNLPSIREKVIDLVMRIRVGGRSESSASGLNLSFLG